MEVEAVREKVKAVPKLRFAEFNGAWSAGPLENVLDLKSGYIFKSETYVEGGRFRVITIANVQDGRMSFERVSTVAELPDNIRDFQVLKQGDILISLTGNVGRVCLVEVDDCLLNQRVGKLVPKAQVDKDFLYQVLRNEKFLNAMVEQAQGGAQDNLSSKDVLGYEATLPTLPEQQKIAAFLSAVDRKIQQLKRKQELLERYKKGVVQQLFSQELRFKRKDGGEFPEWEEKRLGDIGDTFNGLTGKAGDDFGEGKPFITYKQIFDSSKINLASCERVRVESDENQVRVKKGDVFFTTSSETREEVGFASVLLDEVDEVYLNSFSFGYRIHSHKVLSPDFARFLFRSDDFREDMIKLGQGSTRYNISKTGFREITVQLPSFEEQSRIAGFLMALDAKVAAVAQAVAAAQKWKKGLLQQMFV